MHDEKIDFSKLDPARDPIRWNRLVESTISRVLMARTRPATIGYQMMAWARPVLAIAAGVALAVSIREVLLLGRHVNGASSAEPAFVLASWAASGERPETSKILQVLGNSYADH